jgi:hypothetical protein
MEANGGFGWIPDLRRDLLGRQGSADNGRSREERNQMGPRDSGHSPTLL